MGDGKFVPVVIVVVTGDYCGNGSGNDDVKTGVGYKKHVHNVM